MKSLSAEFARLMLPAFVCDMREPLGAIFKHPTHGECWTPVIKDLSRVAIAAGLVFTYMRDLSIAQGWQLVKNNPFQSLLSTAALFTLSPSISTLTLGTWTCFQSLTILVHGVAIRDKFQIAYAIGGYFAGKIILDHYSYYAEFGRFYLGEALLQKTIDQVGLTIGFLKRCCKSMVGIN